jgi:regulation of enolase protein 1 (concanavalin A-like superfamily)
MSEIVVESFARNIEENLLRWHCEPGKFEILEHSLVIETEANTDFWQRTHYGFKADNGHFLFCEVEGDFVMETSVSYSFKNQYDQAGLMIRISPECWIKTAVEYEPDEPNKLGAVVTNNGYSDWSTQNVGNDLLELSFRIAREGSDYIVSYREINSNEWTQLRMTHLEEASKVQCGLYACSPKESGFKAEFNSLSVLRSK